MKRVEISSQVIQMKKENDQVKSHKDEIASAYMLMHRWFMWQLRLFLKHDKP